MLSHGLLYNTPWLSTIPLALMGFFLTPGVSGTVIEPSVDVDDGGAGSVKQSRLAFSRCAADIVHHTSTVSLCLA